MSDSSDSDGSLTNNMFTFRSESTVVSARGPNINFNNITDLSFRNNNVFSSTLQVPRPYETQRYAHSSYDQRSISNRDISPMKSVRSAYHRRHKNFNYSYKHQRTGGPRSMYNGRSQSPMSVGSIESTASAYVLDAAQVLNNANYNEYELDILEEACYKFLNTRIKRKIEKTYVSTSNSSQRSIPAKSNMPTFSNVFKKPAAPMMTQKERFKSRYLLPSQRFNKSIIPTSIQENTENELCEENFQNGRIHVDRNSERNIETDSDEEIFSNTANENPHKNRKRSIDSEDLFLPNTKRAKPCKNMQQLPLSPCKNSIEAQKNKASKESNDFVFAKPVCPARKSIKEKLISKSAAPLTDTVPQISILPPETEQSQSKDRPEKPEDDFEDEQSNSTANSTNLSMRPSFIKRKLFTQSLDVAEKANMSGDNMDSPPKNHSAIQKEKHKTRKLQQATTQSCLSRDIGQDESNLLDLIQKIVPIDQMNMTNQTNSTVSHKNMTEEDNDKWDGPSTISPNKNDDNESETYTDEEMLDHTVKELQKEDAAKKPSVKSKRKVSTPKKNAVTTKCNVVLEKLTAIEKQPIIKHFWETDFETDDEMTRSPKTDRTITKEIRKPTKDIMQPKEAPRHEIQDLSSLFNSKKSNTTSILNPSSQNYTFDTTQKFSNTFRIRCHKPLKRNKIDRVTNSYESVVQKLENKQKENPESAPTKVSDQYLETANVKDSKKDKTVVAVKGTKKSPKAKKATPKTDGQNIKQSNSKTQTKNEDHANKTETNAKKNQRTQYNKEIIIDNNAPTKNQSNSKENLAPSKVSHDKNTNNKESNTQTKKKSNAKENNTLTKQRSKSKENITQTKKQLQTNSKEKILESKTTRKGPNTKNITQKNNFSLIEENNNKSNRPVRTCRTNSLNRSVDKSILAQDDSMNRTLRPRKNLNMTANKNNAKDVQKTSKNNLARLSDISFSLGEEKSSVVRKTMTKITIPQFNADDSDVSFSLDPTPKKTRANSSRNNQMFSTPLRKNPSRIKMHIWDMKPIKTTRTRTPNKRYIC